jgi:hypothetical protein
MQSRSPYLHVCEHAFLDQHQRVCLIGIFDLIEARFLPATVDRLCIAGSLLGRPTDLVPVTVTVVREGTRVAVVEYETQLKCHPDGFILEMSGLQFPRYGRYAITIFLTPGTPLAVTFVTVRPQQIPQTSAEVMH